MGSQTGVPFIPLPFWYFLVRGMKEEEAPLVLD